MRLAMRKMMQLKLTANMVTVARILLLPAPCAMLLYGNDSFVWFAFALFVLLGMTDFVDGMMARRDGPTKLGGLIDPVADKIFVAATLLPLVTLNVLPVAFAVALLSRELLITALRTCIALRQESVKTSFWGKLKTIVQMGGMGTIFLTIFCEKTPLLIMASFLFTSLSLVAVYLVIKNKKRPPHWVFPVTGSFLFWFVALFFFSKDTAIFMQMTVIISITWISAFNYLWTTYQIFARTGFYKYDIIRLFWVAAHSLCVLPFLENYFFIMVPILISISLEFALGGVDNVVAAERQYADNQPFAVTACLAILFGFFMCVNITGLLAVSPVFLSSGLSLGSVIVFTFTYRKWHFLFVRALD
jgi:cardiolipin synthase (CMP-forming)